MYRTPTRARAQAFHRQGGRCFYCSVRMWTDDVLAFAARYGLPRSAAMWLQCTAEHLHARQDGGRDASGNVVAACRWCNHRRHSRRVVAPAPEEYAKLVTRRVQAGRWHVEAVHRSCVMR